MEQSSPNEKKRRWLNKHLELEAGQRGQLQRLENEVYEFCREYSKNPSPGRRLIIWGGNGCGKTHVARRVHMWAKSIATRLPLTSVPNGNDEDVQVPRSEYLFWPAVVDGFKQNRWQIIDDVLYASMLVIDDIGAEHDPSGIGREKLYHMLERRAQRWTLLTTNIPASDWAVKFENRIASRFLRNCTSIDLSDVPDYCAT